MADFLTKLSDSELVDKANYMWTVLNAAPADYLAKAEKVTELKTKADSFGDELTAHVAAQTAAQAQTKTKNLSRDSLEKIIRNIIQNEKLNDTSEDKILNLGVPVGGQSDAPSNATRPFGICDTSQRLEHGLDFRDEATPGTRRKPRLVLGSEIYRKIGGAQPVDLKECEFLTLDTVTPYKVQYDGADAGKMVHYIFRWRFKDESVSSLSETVSATVTG